MKITFHPHESSRRGMITAWRVLINSEWRAIIHREHFDPKLYFLTDANGEFLVHNNRRVELGAGKQREWRERIEHLERQHTIPTLLTLQDKRQRDAHAKELLAATADIFEQQRRYQAAAAHLYKALKMMQRLIRDGEAMTDINIRAIEDALARAEGREPDARVGSTPLRRLEKHDAERK
jgi:hypothetical protein